MVSSRGPVRWPGRWKLLSVQFAGLLLALATGRMRHPRSDPRSTWSSRHLPLPAIERFPACQPEKGGQFRVENGPNGRSRVALAVLVLNQRETIVMLEAPGQRRVAERAVQLAADNTLLVWMIGPPGAALSVSVTGVGACLDVAITDPSAGAAVPEGPLLVRGTVHAPAQAGVSVNGVPAMVHGSQWAVRDPGGSHGNVPSRPPPAWSAAPRRPRQRRSRSARHRRRPSSSWPTPGTASRRSPSPGK